eukprot:scaffold49868_cov57-Phaeocystis_antarctica.AAC.1
MTGYVGNDSTVSRSTVSEALMAALPPTRACRRRARRVLPPRGSRSTPCLNTCTRPPWPWSVSCVSVRGCGGICEASRPQSQGVDAWARRCRRAGTLVLTSAPKLSHWDGPW